MPATVVSSKTTLLPGSDPTARFVVETTPIPDPEPGEPGPSGPAGGLLLGVADLYVSTLGDDVYGDGTVNAPYRTAQRAAEVALGKAVPPLIQLGTGSFGNLNLQGALTLKFRGSGVMDSLLGTITVSNVPDQGYVKFYLEGIGFDTLTAIGAKGDDGIPGSDAPENGESWDGDAGNLGYAGASPWLLVRGDFRGTGARAVGGLGGNGGAGGMGGTPNGNGGMGGGAGDGGTAYAEFMGGWLYEGGAVAGSPGQPGAGGAAQGSGIPGDPGPEGSVVSPGACGYWECYIVGPIGYTTPTNPLMIDVY